MFFEKSVTTKNTSMHSSRIHTVRYSSHLGGGGGDVCPGDVCGRGCLYGGDCQGGCLLGGVCLGIWPGGYLARGVSGQGVSARGGGCLARGCLARVCLPGGGVCPGGCLPHPSCEQNHRRLWKHNRAATTLRTVITEYKMCNWMKSNGYKLTDLWTQRISLC